MRVHFLGTAASPSVPVPFCVCPACRTARSAGGKNLRSRSSLIVDGELLVDLGPDIATGAGAQGVGLDGVRWCLQTHPHEDHFDPELIISRHPEWGATVAEELVIAASRKTLEQMDALFQRRCRYGTLFDGATQRALRLRVEELAAFRSRSLGRYRITPYPANHAIEYQSLLYSIESGERAVFYGTDTSVITESVWEDVRSRGVRFDLVILDHTYGIGVDASDHLSAAEVERCAAGLSQRKVLKTDGVVYATHLSHEGLLEHDRMDAYAREHGYRIAYDGLEIRL